MKIKVKPWEDVKKTLDRKRKTNSGAYFSPAMGCFCGTTIDAEFTGKNAWDHIAKAEKYYWHPDWFDIVEEENTLSVGNENTFTTTPEEPEIIKQTREQIKLLQAFVDGKEIESKYKYSNKWNHIAEPRWNWLYLDYRVKEEPRFRPYTLEEFLVFAKEGRDYCIYDDGYTTLIGACRLIVNYRGMLYCHRTPAKFLEECRWEDGSRCGVMV